MQPLDVDVARIVLTPDQVPLAAPTTHLALQIAGRLAEIADPDGLRVVIHGPMELSGIVDGREVRLAGRDASSRVEETLRGASLEVAAGPNSGQVELLPLLDLVEGVVAAGSIRLSPAVEAELRGPAATGLRALETRLGRQIVITAEPNRERTAFDILPR